MSNEANNTKQVYRVTLLGSVVNFLLLALKFVAGIVGNSAAMVADAVHSLSDFVTDLQGVALSIYGPQGQATQLQGGDS